jgi:hypothetical protein
MNLVLELYEAATHLPSENSAAQTQRLAMNPAMLYCLFIVLLPLVAVPLFVALGKSDFFLHHGASVWVQSNDAVFNMQNRHCDVLVFGDSTAMTGIDPEVVQRDTGFRTCNIAVTNAVLAVTGNLTLDHFLQQNARPKMLIVQLSPDEFQPENLAWNHTIYAEGLLELLRHGSPEEGRHLLLTHPHDAIAFAGYVAGFSAYYGIKDLWFRTTHLRPEEDQVQVHNGFFTPPAPPRTYCDASAKLSKQDSASTARAIATSYLDHYESRSAVVLVDVAPIPSCDDNLAAYSTELRGVTSNTLQPLPISLFNDGRHYTAFGSRVVSTLIARQVNQIAEENPGLDDRELPANDLASIHNISLPR